MADKKVAEQYFSPPPELGKWEGFRIFMWNSETGQFMGRTGSSWAKIIVFYLIFYSVLVGFFAAILAVFYQTLDYKMPKWQMDSSLIGSNPGLGFRPMPPESTVDSTLIWYRANDKGSVNKWANEIDTFLEVYRPTDKGADNRVKCTDGSPAPPGKVCAVPIDDWDPCITSKHYNYAHAGPCIFLKLNKIFAWEPDLYNDTTALPSGMPQELKTYINTVKSSELNTVWVSCEGENPADVENMGAIHYLPRRGFPSFYFPFTNVEGYVSPLVAVRFEKPRAGVLINIECKAWAKNIHHDRYERRGSVHFELMVD